MMKTEVQMSTTLFNPVYRSLPSRDITEDACCHKLKGEQVLASCFSDS